MDRIIERLTIRTVLLAGFGLMLGLWLLRSIRSPSEWVRRSATAPGSEHATSNHRSCSRRCGLESSKHRCS